MKGKRKMNRTLIAIALALTLIPGFAVAATWNASDIVLSGTVGSGGNASYLVVDFSSASYAFKYLWDAPTTGTLTGENLILALTDSTAGVTGLSVAYDVWTGLGMAPNTFSYDGNSGVADYPNPYWNYWTGSAGEAQAYSWVGCSGSYLTNGSIDSWVFSADWTQAPSIPGVPEPSSMLALGSLIGLAGSAKLLRGRRK